MKKKPIRIIQFIGSLNTGGSQSMVMNIYRNIDRNKIQFDFIVDRKEELLYYDEILRLGGKVYIFNEFFKGTNYYKYEKQWKDFFESHKEYKIIHCHVRSVAAIVLRIAKKYNLITICHSHSTSNGNGIKVFLKKFLQSKIKKYCDYFFACSKESATWLYGNLIANSEKCFIINNAIDSKKYVFNKIIRNKIRKKYHIENKIVIGQVGRLTEVKNYEFTLKLLKQLVDKNNSYFLMIVGAGQLRKKIDKQIEDNNLKDNVIILENRNDVNELMQAMDIYVMPSLWEGLPLALVEAQASSLPCIISSNITDGILIHSLVKKLNLDDINLWINEINRITNDNFKRVDVSKMIIDSGFDINTNVRTIMDFYLKL